MPEPVPVPATDQQLRSAADQATNRWIDERLRAVRDKWASTQSLEQALAGIPAGPRRTWWIAPLRRFVEDRTRGIEGAVGPRRREAVEQAYTALREVTPTPSQQDLGRPTPELTKTLTDIAAATPVGRELTALAAEAETAVSAFVERAARLERLREGKSAELSAVDTLLRDRIARTDRYEAGARALHAPDLLRVRVHLLFEARDRAQRSAPPEQIGDEASHALRRALDRGMDESDQRKALETAYDDAIAAATAAEAELAAQFDVLGEHMVAHYARFGFSSGRYLRGAERFVDFYGPQGFAALLAVDNDTSGTVFDLLGWDSTPAAAHLEMSLRKRWPAGTSTGQLIRVLRLIKAESHQSTHQLPFIVEEMSDDPGAPPRRG